MYQNVKLLISFKLFLFENSNLFPDRYPFAQWEEKTFLILLKPTVKILGQTFMFVGHLIKNS